MGVEITDAIDGQTVYEAHRAVRGAGWPWDSIGNQNREEWNDIAARVRAAALSAAPSSVGVTSSDERAATGPLPAPATIAYDGPLNAVPSSDEPEGDDAWERVETVLLGWGLDEADVEPAVADIRKLLAAAPVSVGDAEPVAHIWWGPTSVEDRVYRPGNPVHEDAIPVFRLPVSSQDAGGARLAAIGREAEAFLRERLGLDPTSDVPPSWWRPAGDAPGDEADEEGSTRRVLDRLFEDLDAAYGQLGDVESRAVDLVLPAEGERRDELIRLMIAKTLSETRIEDALISGYDVLREAAAGKAGSDDAA